MSSDFWLHVVQALVLGLLVGVTVYFLRGLSVVRRVRWSVLLAAGLVALYWTVRDSGLPREDDLERITLTLSLLAVANALLQIFDRLVWETLAQRRGMVVPRLVVDLFNVIVLVVVGLLVLNAVFGVDLSALLVTSTVVSAVIGLALQDMLGNVIAGVALQIEQPFSVGDWVLASGHEGRVVQMNWRSLTLVTRDNNHVVVPNGNVAKQDVVNFSRPQALQRAHAQVDVAYDHAPGEVKQVLYAAVRGTSGVVDTPLPEVIVDRFSESAVTYDVRYWITDTAAYHPIRDRVLTRAWYALRRAGMSIPYPTHDVRLRTYSPDEQRQQEQAQQHAIFTALRPLSLFGSLADEHIERMAQQAALLRFTTGEALVRQGESGASLFVIMAGRVRVEIEQNGTPVRVNTLLPGEFFGEMSLLTGVPRSASVVAEAETDVIVVDKADIAALLSEDSLIVEALSIALEERAQRSAEQLAVDAEARSGKLPRSVPLRDRIRSFFGIK